VQVETYTDMTWRRMGEWRYSSKHS